jgi:hypothetical protein
LPAVRASACSTSFTMRGSKRWMSPIARKRTPFACSFSISCSSAATKSCMRKVTSSLGRRQFSLLNAKSVR